MSLNETRSPSNDKGVPSQTEHTVATMHSLLETTIVSLMADKSDGTQPPPDNREQAPLSALSPQHADKREQAPSGTLSPEHASDKGDKAPKPLIEARKEPLHR